MSLTNQDIDISMDNVVQYANQIRMPLDSSNKETQKQILSVMEAQRIASGLNVTTFYNTLLGSTCSYKTIQHIREGTKQMPLELVLAFCYVFHYDISELINIQSEKNRAERFADYMQIGASIEALGPHIIYNAARKFSPLLRSIFRTRIKPKKSKASSSTNKKSPVQSSLSGVRGSLFLIENVRHR